MTKSLEEQGGNGNTEVARMAPWAGLYQNLQDAITTRSTRPPQDDMNDVLLNTEIAEKAVFHRNSVTRGFRSIPVTFAPGGRAT